MTPTSGDIIRSTRQARGFSQEFVALKLGITQQSYSNLEKKPDGATLGRLKELAKVLDIDLMTMIGETSTMVQNNLNQQGGQAASNMVINQNSEQKGAYQRMIDHLEEEIEFLRKFLEQHGKIL
jgi:transcriptional regulator with XRE-family HTH domain